MAEKEAVEREYTDKVEQYQKTMKIVREHTVALKVSVGVQLDSACVR